MRGKPAPQANQPAKDKVEAEQRVEIPKEPVSNQILGDILEHLIDINFPLVREKIEISYPQYLPLKICLMGKTYSGKSTIARYLNNRYGVEIVSIESLLSHTINKYGDCEDSFDHSDEEEDLGLSMIPLLGSNIIGSEDARKILDNPSLAALDDSQIAVANLRGPNDVVHEVAGESQENSPRDSHHGQKNGAG